MAGSARSITSAARTMFPTSPSATARRRSAITFCKVERSAPPFGTDWPGRRGRADAGRCDSHHLQPARVGRWHAWPRHAGYQRRHAQRGWQRQRVVIGVQGSGAVIQTAGIVNAGGVVLGFDPGASGSYALSNGTLNATSEIVSDDANTCSFQQTGGVNSSPALTLASFSSSSRATYTLTSGTLIASSETIGASGTGTFIQLGSAIPPAASFPSPAQAPASAHISFLAARSSHR